MLKRFARAAVKPLSVAADRLLPPPPGVTILIYHRVGAGSGGEVDLDVDVFADQMAALSEAHVVISLDDAVALLESGERPERDPVVLTFDDGTPDVVNEALPILERHGLPMTLYLATSHVDQGVGFWHRDDPALSWSALRDALSTGLVDIGSHTHSHALLDRLDEASAAVELDRSIGLIQDRLGVDPRHFAYPKALAPNVAADALVRSRFRSAAIAGTRPNPYGVSDLHLLSRSPIQRSDSMRWFTAKAAGGMGLEDRIRDQLNRRRYADAVR